MYQAQIVASFAQALAKAKAALRGALEAQAEAVKAGDTVAQAQWSKVIPTRRQRVADLAASLAQALKAA